MTIPHQHTLHTQHNYWVVDPERRLIMDPEGVIRAYSEIQASLDERLTIAWSPSRFGERTTYAGTVLRTTDDSAASQRTFDEQVRRQAARHQALLVEGRELRQVDSDERDH